MNSRRFIIACTLVAVGVVTTISFGVNSQAATPDPALPPFEFHREGAASPEDAAVALFRGCAARSPRHFVQHLLLGVCDGPINTLQKFAEALHKTKFTHGKDSFTVYDFPIGKGINTKKPIRMIAIEEFDSEDKRVAALWVESFSTYYGETFLSVDVAAESYDGLEYRTRIVVARVNARGNDRWYAIPRCRSSKSFYAIADSMHLPSPAAKQAQ
ncbi:MAG: hypothetical protein WBC44_20255 [Planctomycetaceae bacterium]